MKKTVLTAIMIFAASITYAAIEAPFSVEVRGSYMNTPFSGFNEYYSGLFSYSFTIDSPGSTFSEMAGIETIAGYMPVQDTVVYMRLGYSMAMHTDTLYDTYHNTDVVVSEAVFGIFYAGAGVRQRFPVMLPDFALFMAADAGVCFNINSYWNVEADTSVYFVNPDFGIQKSDFSGDPFLGINLEAGFEWKLLDFAGISAFAGYRMSNFSINFIKEGLFADPHYDQPVEVDISGFYFGGGLNFYFSSSTAPVPVTAGALPDEGEPVWRMEEKEADALYSRKEYQAAITGYASALKADGPFSIYKKISAAYYRLGDVKKAVHYGGVYLRYFPEDAAFKNWLDKTGNKLK